MHIFLQYLELKRCRPLLEFCLAATNFRNQLETAQVTPLHSDGNHNHTAEGSQAQGDAMVLYDKYFSLQVGKYLRNKVSILLFPVDRKKIVYILVSNSSNPYIAQTPKNVK